MILSHTCWTLFSGWALMIQYGVTGLLILKSWWIKRRQVQSQQSRQSNTFRFLQEGLERECFISLHFLHSNHKAWGRPCNTNTHELYRNISAIWSSPAESKVSHLWEMWLHHCVRTLYLSSLYTVMAKISAPLVNMIKEGCENYFVNPFDLLFKKSQKSNLSLDNKNL